MLHASRYQNVAISDWELRSCVGHNAAAFDAIQARQCGLSQHELGWIGQIGAQASELHDLAIDCARPLIERHQTLKNEMPICCLSSSKGCIEQALEGSLQIDQSLPSSLAGSICRATGIPHYIGHSCAAACSTGLYTLLDAADLLAAGHSSVAFAGAADASLHPMLLGAYHNLKVMAQVPPEAFTGNGTGFAPAEGAAFFKLEPQGTWQLKAGVRAADAKHITRCEDASVLNACLQALWEHVPEPDLIVTHATGTAHGDAFESRALAHGPWSAAELLHCKPAIGHCLGASGCVELAIGLHSTAQRIWKLSLGFGGHIAALALTRNH